ncbi:MAG: sigma-70 family RNA polymerase sigma factor [Actinomycetota bacterium]|nr:sigma-70 family RNA polymerase sigma factor [Actinomycetota bacterium]
MDPESASDEELLGAHLKGDGRAYQTLMRRHEDRIFSLALRMTGDRGDALDATQETFISAFRRASKFRGEASFATWLYRIGINSCKDVLRRRRRLPDPVEEIEEAPAADRVEDQAISRIDVARALAALPDEYRDAVTMYDIAGFAYDEIAQQLDVPVGTVKSRISRGRQQLAAGLEQRPDDRASKE